MSSYKEPNFPALLAENYESLRKFDRDLITALGEWGLSLKAVLDGGITVADNVDAYVASYTSNAVANTEDAVPHGLGKVPLYFIVAGADKAGVVYRGTTAFTKTNVYLKCSAASTALKIVLL